jgi:polyhydroxybutyrate depolymerase
MRCRVWRLAGKRWSHERRLNTWRSSVTLRYHDRMLGPAAHRGAHIAIVLSGLLTQAAGAAALQSKTIELDGQLREYLLASPVASHTDSRPLVILLHGHLGTARNALGAGTRPSPLSAWLDIVDREQILVVALQGLKGPDGQTGWHDCRKDAAGNPRADDVKFASTVARELIASGRADPRRLYVMGMSNGAMMSQRLAVEMQPAPAAITAVAGTIALGGECRDPTHPVSVLIIHGTDDPLVPYAGGPVGFGGHGQRGAVLGAEATRDLWRRVDGLKQVAPVAKSFAHLGADATRVRSVSYGPDTGPQVELVTIEHGGHIEPSLRFHYGPLYEHLVGLQNRDFESAEHAWAFFAPKHRE